MSSAKRGQATKTVTKTVQTAGSEPTARAGHAIKVELTAVLVAVAGGEPRVMTRDEGHALPSGPFEVAHRSLQAGLRDWVEQQTHHPLGYVEQLYTFADKDRTGEESEARTISISYLGLTRQREPAEGGWRSWYDYFPWEDHRAGEPAMIGKAIAPRLMEWAQAESGPKRADRLERARVTFALEGHAWNDELALQRYELLYEAGLVAESCRSRAKPGETLAGRAMFADHRRILATGIARLRAKIKYRPVVFELMPPTFTLLQLQRCVEALAGRAVHKQNFRRLVEQQELVEETGATTSEAVGRPAKLFRFRHGVVVERAVAGTKVPLART
ncbi:NUDIX hydrolase [Xanthobacter pseudotagetidis]|uniref:NUDIX hydrolase n=1 Tax=Xanthobacter pseudotagetidis TaxID=3119911 RepID=UPI003728D159